MTKVAKVIQIHAGAQVTYNAPAHPQRSGSKTYQRSRRALLRIVTSLDGWYFGPGPYDDHHGGGLWVMDEDGWFFVRNLVGIEWSAQFCADPKKVDALRMNARRLYAAFPKSFPAFAALGIDLRKLLSISGVTTAVASAAMAWPGCLHLLAPSLWGRGTR